jgi:endonuclease
VRQHFPTSRWQKTHWHWYKSKIKTGAIPVPGIVVDAPQEDDEIDTDIEDSIESSVSLEQDLHLYLSARVGEIEAGLTLVDNGVEYHTEAGDIDL